MAPTGVRDELYTDAHGLAGSTQTMLEPADASSLIEDWIDESSNLPLELKRMSDELAERRDRIDGLNKILNQRESSLQRWIRTHGSHVPNPKEAEYKKVITETMKQIRELLAENVRQSEDTKKLLDKRVLALDKGIKKLVDRGELQEDPDLPSLLKPAAPASLQSDGPADLLASAFLPTSSVPPINPYRNVGRSTAGLSTGQRAVLQQSSTGHPTVQVNSISVPAIPTLVAAQKARESSAGAQNKRPRLTGNLAIPPVAGNLARQTSLGPGTPKSNSLGTSSRAGSAGPRPPKTGSATTKKVGLPKSSRKSHLHKSSLHRIKRMQNGGSPSSNNDSDQSDGEDASIDDDDLPTPPPHRNGDNVMEEEEVDNKKYCICQKASEGDMVGCDNLKCPYEWFHWKCVGITRAPENSWYCNTPACNRIRGLDRK